MLLVFVSATFLRLNNIGMVQRRDAVESADKQGDIYVLQNRLYDLQRYVASHMNADPGKIALVGQHERDYQKAKKAAADAAAATPGQSVYAEVTATCDARAKMQGWLAWGDPRYNACTDEEYAKYPEASLPSATLKTPSPDLYYHTYTSPLWSPDFAGFSALAALLVLLVIIARLIGIAVLRLMLRSQYQSV